MQAVGIAYKARRATGPAQGHINRTLPDSWQEMPPELAWRCMDMVIRGYPRRHIVEHLLQLPGFIQDRIETGEMYDLIRTVDWMELDTTSCMPIAAYIDITAHDRLHLPSDKFANVTALEYVLLDEMYQEYVTSEDADLEARMIAIILRPSGPSPDPASDKRVQLLSIEQTHAWLDLVRTLPEATRLYMMTLISANRKYVHDTYGHWLFESSPASVSEDGETPPSDTSSGLNFGWWGAYLDVAEDGIFGTYDQVLQTAFHTVCMHMIRKVQTARERKQEQDHAMARASA